MRERKLRETLIRQRLAG